MIHMFRFLILSILLFGVFSPVLAQQDKQQSFSSKMRAVSEDSAVAGKTSVVFWGIEAVEGSNVQLKLKARTMLDNVMSNEAVSCTLKDRSAEALTAQCVSHDDIDLGLFMLQNGYVVVDRSAIYGTVFEQPYLEAEREAQNNQLGLWNTDLQKSKNGGSLLLSLGFVLLVLVVIAFVALSIFIMRGFQKVIDAQQQNMDFAAKERVLKDKERQIFATMMDSEIKANKSKIEAYMTVYDEMLRSLQDPDKTPKYQTAGDLVQEQPALSRSVFDRNTDKLDVLGDRLSSDVVHFYARIKSKAEYVNLEPDMPIDQAIEIIEKALSGAKRLNKISDRIIDAFEEGGLSSDDLR